MFREKKCVAVVWAKHPGEGNESGRSGNVIQTHSRTRWDALGCAWKSHWEETTVSILCLQTSIQAFLLFQQKLQAFTAPYWSPQGANGSLSVSFAILPPDHAHYVLGSLDLLYSETIVQRLRQEWNVWNYFLNAPFAMTITRWWREKLALWWGVQRI